MAHGKKSFHHNRTRIGGCKLQSVFEFNERQVAVITKGLVFFEESFQRNKVTLPNLAFAGKLYNDVLEKVTLGLMCGEEVTFDYNELLILSACLDMVVIDAAFVANPGDFTVAIELNGRVKQCIAVADRKYASANRLN